MSPLLHPENVRKLSDALREHQKRPWHNIGQHRIIFKQLQNNKFDLIPKINKYLKRSQLPHDGEHHLTETSQSICRENQLTGICTVCGPLT